MQTGVHNMIQVLKMYLAHVLGGAQCAPAFSSGLLHQKSLSFIAEVQHLAAFR